MFKSGKNFRNKAIVLFKKIVAFYAWFIWFKCILYKVLRLYNFVNLKEEKKSDMSNRILERNFCISVFFWGVDPGVVKYESELPGNCSLNQVTETFVYSLRNVLYENELKEFFPVDVMFYFLINYTLICINCEWMKLCEYYLNES